MHTQDTLERDSKGNAMGQCSNFSGRGRPRPYYFAKSGANKKLEVSFLFYDDINV